METSYIKSLVTPATKQPQGRKVWSIDLQAIWLPFFTATNAQGDTAIPSAALGAPLRLAYDKAGAVRFSQAGRPTIRVAKELSDSIKVVRDNFTANLLNYAGEVIRDNPDGYKAQAEQAQRFGLPLQQYDRNQLNLAMQARIEAEEARQAEAKAKADTEAKANAVAEAESITTENKAKGRKRELVTA